MEEELKPALFIKERREFVKTVYDMMFEDHPELLKEEHKDWFNMYVKYPFIVDYDKMIFDEYGDDCTFMVELRTRQLKSFTYEFLKYIEEVLSNYGYKFFIPEI